MDLFANLMPVEIPQDIIDAYIKEKALAMFDDGTIEQALSLSPHLVNQLQADPDVQAKIRATAKAMQETGEGFKEQAKRLADASLQQLAEVANNPDEKGADRVKACELLIKVAGLMPKEEPSSVNISLSTIINEAAVRKELVLQEGRDYLTHE